VNHQPQMLSVKRGIIIWLIKLPKIRGVYQSAFAGWISCNLMRSKVWVPPPKSIFVFILTKLCLPEKIRDHFVTI
ncbi:MAG: hypothetical protein WAU55_03160, partial [Dehalococcoidales bacterium]